MSERHKTHNGRDMGGHYRVKQTDLEDTLEDPRGADFVRDDVRLGGAVADTGPHAGSTGECIERLIDENRADVEQVVGRDRARAKRAAGGRKRRASG